MASSSKRILTCSLGPGAVKNNDPDRQRTGRVLRNAARNPAASFGTARNRPTELRADHRECFFKSLREMRYAALLDFRLLSTLKTLVVATR